MTVTTANKRSRRCQKSTRSGGRDITDILSSGEVQSDSEASSRIDDTSDGTGQFICSPTYEEEPKRSSKQRRLLKPNSGGQGMSPFDHYLKVAGRSPLLSRQEETELALIAEAGNPRAVVNPTPEDVAAKQAVTKLVAANLRLVVNMAKKYRVRRTEIEDLIGAGNYGLCEATLRFESARGFRLSTYASSWIRMRMSEYVMKNRGIHVPNYVYELVGPWSKAVARLVNRGEKPTSEAVCAILAEVGRVVSPSKAACIEQGLSVLNPITTDDFSYRQDCRQTLDHIENREDIAQMLEALETLSDREKVVLRMRFGLDGGQPETLCSVGNRLGLTRERIRQIQEEAIGKLKITLDA